MSNINRSFSLLPIEATDFFKNFELSPLSTEHWQPKADIIEEEKQYIIKIDIPGVSPKDIEILVNKNTITIKGERETKFKEKKENFVHYERSKGSFFRRIVLPEAIEDKKVSAKNENGVLIVTLPKQNQKAATKIVVTK